MEGKKGGRVGKNGRRWRREKDTVGGGGRGLGEGWSIQYRIFSPMTAENAKG